MINRDSKGHFISQYEALSAWLPRMLSWVSCNALEEMLSIGARWCSSKAGDELSSAARSLKEDWGQEGFWEIRTAAAKRWLQRRTVLINAISELVKLR